MRTLQITATIALDRTLKVQLPPEIPAGDYQIVLVMAEKGVEEKPVPQARQPFKFPVDDYGPWPTDLSLRREDMYDDFGR